MGLYMANMALTFFDLISVTVMIAKYKLIIIKGDIKLLKCSQNRVDFTVSYIRNAITLRLCVTKQKRKPVFSSCVSINGNRDSS
jgi:hypothetical protein